MAAASIHASMHPSMKRREEKAKEEEEEKEDKQALTLSQHGRQRCTECLLPR
jgi:hypothetical protein